MTIIETYVFTWVASTLSPLWNDSAGRIFLLTFLAYAISYMVYSGYVSSFAKGMGGLPLSQTGFTAMDFLTLVPAVFLLIARAAKAAFPFIAQYILLPFALYFMIASVIWIFNLQSPLGGSASLANLGILLWFSGIMYRVISEQAAAKPISLALSAVGAVLVGLTTSRLGYVNAAQVTDQAQSLLIVLRIVNEIVALPLLLVLSVFPYLIGVVLGELAIKEKLLQEISILVLREPIPLSGNVAAMRKRAKKKVLEAKKADQAYTIHNAGALHEYTWTEEKPMYLIASFAQITALFAPPATTGGERGEMIFVRNDAILSLSLKGRIYDDKPQDKTVGKS